MWPRPGDVCEMQTAPGASQATPFSHTQPGDGLFRDYFPRRRAGHSAWCESQCTRAQPASACALMLRESAGKTSLGPCQLSALSSPLTHWQFSCLRAESFLSARLTPVCYGWAGTSVLLMSLLAQPSLSPSVNSQTQRMAAESSLFKERNKAATEQETY